MATEFTSCTGRLVWGDVFTPQNVTNDDGTPKPDPKTGQQMIEYAFGVAYAKNDPEWPAFHALLKGADAAEWPQFHDPATKQVRPGVQFADKIIDGDGYDSKGNLRSRKEGYAGCWIVNYGSQFPVSAHRHDGRQWVQVTDKAAIKRGYYVRVSGSTQSNKSTQSPGMYRNPSMVAFVAYGPEIVSQGGDPNAAFGAAPAPLPPGASATPLAPPAGAPTAPATTQAPPATPAAPYGGYYRQPAPPPAPAVAPPPAPAVAPPPAPTVAPPPAKQWAITKGDAQYQAYLAAGWTDVQMIQQGLMQDEIPV